MHLKSIAARHCPDAPLVKLAATALKYVPGVLDSLGKV